MLRLDDDRSPFPDGELGNAVELGAVDSQAVRVWIRRPNTREVHATLEVAGKPRVTGSVALGPETDWTGAIVLTLPEPAPGEDFICTVDGQRRTGQFAPADGTNTGFAFAFGSCHRPFTMARNGHIGFNSAAGIYPAMLDELRQVEAKFLLLVGDQVYSDELEPISVRRNLPQGLKSPPTLPVLLERYREIYRGYLGHTGFRQLRENLPTYCIWDDHDIFDNWGSLRRESPLDRRMFEAACRAYSEYQHQRNPRGTIGPPPYWYTFQYGDVGFLVLDVRGARDFTQRTLLGEEQWNGIRAFLSGEGAAHLQTLFVVTSVPIAHTARWVALFLSWLPIRVASSVRDRWCTGAFIRERDDLLARLFAWQMAMPRRQVIILSGDIHMANAFTVGQRYGPGVVHQFTSSALSTPHGRLDSLLNRIVSRGSNLFESKFWFQRRLLGFENNFGLVRVQPLPDGGHHVEFTVRGWQPKVEALRTVGQIHCYPDEIDREGGPEVGIDRG